MIDKVFCSIPWTEVHINADGTYHSCGAQPNTITGSSIAATYNVRNMTIHEWMDSVHQKNARDDKLAGIANPLCNMCYHEDDAGSSSKRTRENQKHNTNISFFKTAKPSVNSFHISLGNECNLACRMCTPVASSKIAVQEIKAGTFKGAARMNWTEDQNSWEHISDYLCQSEELKFIHLVGGEPLLNPRFEQLIDLLLAANKTDIYLGFTTNGTVFSESLMHKLNAFRHVDIGISIECTGRLNDLIRQGSTTQIVLDNIELYLKHRKEGQVYVTVRTVPSALSVHTLDDLYRWCADRQIDIMTNMLVRPVYQQIKHLPGDVKERLLEQYSKWEYSVAAPVGSNPRDPTWFKQHLDDEIKAVINELKLPNNPKLTQELYDKLALWHWLDEPQIANYFNSSIKA